MTHSKSFLPINPVSLFFKRLKVSKILSLLISRFLAIRVSASVRSNCGSNFQLQHTSSNFLNNWFLFYFAFMSNITWFYSPIFSSIKYLDNLNARLSSFIPIFLIASQSSSNDTSFDEPPQTNSKTSAYVDFIFNSLY